MSLRVCLNRWLAVVMLASMSSVTSAAEESAASGSLPPPTGSYSVGRTHFNWQDASRAAEGNPANKREVVVWVWYPAEARPGATRALWLPGKWQELSADLVNRGTSAAASTASIHAHAFVDAAPAATPKTFPVLLFAPGTAMVPLQYSSLIEDLASHGYVVAAIVPTGYSLSVLGDGRVVPGVKPTPQVIPPGLSPQQLAAQMSEQQGKAAQATDTWSADMLFALTQLTNLNSDAGSPFKGRFDLDRVAAFGHSQGGATSMQLGVKDSRIRAVVNIDGMLPRDLANGGALSKPALALMSDTLKPGARPPGPPPRAEGMPANATLGPPPLLTNSSLDPTAALRTAKPGYLLRLTGSTHLFVSDLGVLQLDMKPNGAAPPPGQGLRLSGSSAATIDAVRALRVSQTYLRAFFDRHLKGLESTLLGGASTDYPEIQFARVSE